MRHRPRVVGMALVAVVLLCCHGCRGSSRFDEDLARRRLIEVAPWLDSGREILLYVEIADGDRPNEYWVLLGQKFSEPPVPDQRSGGDSGLRAARFPASALLSFAASAGVAEDLLGAPQQPDGQLWEWQSDGSSVRLRTVETDEGFLSVVERLP